MVSIHYHYLYRTINTISHKSPSFDVNEIGKLSKKNGA